MYNQHTRGMATTRHRSLVERGGRKAFVKDKERPCTHTWCVKKKGKKCQKNTDIHESKGNDSRTWSFQQSY